MQQIWQSKDGGLKLLSKKEIYQLELKEISIWQGGEKDAKELMDYLHDPAPWGHQLPQGAGAKNQALPIPGGKILLSAPHPATSLLIEIGVQGRWFKLGQVMLTEVSKVETKLEEKIQRITTTDTRQLPPQVTDLRQLEKTPNEEPCQQKI